MGLWKKEIDDIEKKDLYQKYKIGNMQLSLHIQNAYYGSIGGKNTLLDESVYQARIREIIEQAKNLSYSKYCPLPKFMKITMGDDESSSQNAESEKTQNANAADENSIIDDHAPRWDFSKIYLPDATMHEIQKALLIERKKDLLFQQWHLFEGNGRAIVLNFYGKPGTGKSMAAEAIAGYLKKKIYKVNYAQLESKYVGETPKNIKKVFAQAKKENAVLVFDEADSFLGKRLTNITQSADYGVNITRSVMLLELESYEGIVIFTTNLIRNYDAAFKRRILSSIKFDLPDENGRKRIFDLYLNKDLPLSQDVQSDILAQRYDNLSGADIKDLVLTAALGALYRNETNPIIELSDFDAAYKNIHDRNESFADQVEVVHERVSEEQYRKEVGEMQNV